MRAGDKTMIMMLVMFAAVLSLGAACLHLQRKVKEQSEVLTKTETLYNDARREKNRLIIEKAEIEKNNFTLEQINAGLLAGNARLTAERDAAKQQQKEPENIRKAAEPERGGLLPLPAAPTNVISMESYNIFVKNSEQAMLQEDCFTEDYGPLQGVRCYLHDGTTAYCAALSTNYADEIGTVLAVTLRNGGSVMKTTDFCSYAELPLPAADDHDVSGLLDD